jgi:hypothetical protein
MKYTLSELIKYLDDLLLSYKDEWEGTEFWEEKKEEYTSKHEEIKERLSLPVFTGEYDFSLPTTKCSSHDHSKYLGIRTD